MGVNFQRKNLLQLWELTPFRREARKWMVECYLFILSSDSVWAFSLLLRSVTKVTKEIETGTKRGQWSLCTVFWWKIVHFELGVAVEQPITCWAFNLGHRFNFLIVWSFWWDFRLRSCLRMTCVLGGHLTQVHLPSISSCFQNCSWPL